MCVYGDIVDGVAVPVRWGHQVHGVGVTYRPVQVPREPVLRGSTGEGQDVIDVDDDAVRVYSGFFVTDVELYRRRLVGVNPDR